MPDVRRNKRPQANQWRLANCTLEKLQLDIKRNNVLLLLLLTMVEKPRFLKRFRTYCSSMSSTWRNSSRHWSQEEYANIRTKKYKRTLQFAMMAGTEARIMRLRKNTSRAYVMTNDGRSITTRSPKRTNVE